MIVAIGILCIFAVIAWDGIVIFFIDGDIENIYEDDDDETD
jgi:hypothetical protein